MNILETKKIGEFDQALQNIIKHFKIGDNSELQYFAQKLGKTTQQLIDDFENGSLDSWFEKM